MRNLIVTVCLCATGCLFGGAEQSPDGGEPLNTTTGPPDAASDSGEEPPRDVGRPDVAPPDMVVTTDVGPRVDLPSADMTPDTASPTDCPQPMGRWPLDDADAGMARSAIRNGSPPIDLDGVPLVQGRFGMAMRLETGGSGVPTMAHHPIFEVDEGSISFWFQASQESLVGGSQAGLVSKDAEGFDVEGHIEISLVNGDVTYRQQGDNAGMAFQRVISDGGGITLPDQWHHIVVTWEPGRMRLFHDGFLAGDDVLGGWSIAANQEPFAFGYSTARSEQGSVRPTEYPFDGLIDEVSFYDKVLTPAAVAQLLAGCQTNDL